MKKLLIATSNPGKLAEIKSVLEKLPLEILDLSHISIYEKPEETGRTFAENALIKARFYYEKLGIPTLADDGGLEIDAFNGEPGVTSHRWIDPNFEASDEELIKYTLERMKNIPRTKRKAQLRLVMVLIDNKGQVYQVAEKVRGIIPLTPSPNRTPGYPYRSLLFLPEINKFYHEAELTAEEIEKYGHRIKAVTKLLPEIKKMLTSRT